MKYKICLLLLVSAATCKAQESPYDSFLKPKNYEIQSGNSFTYINPDSSSAIKYLKLYPLSSVVSFFNSKDSLVQTINVQIGIQRNWGVDPKASDAPGWSPYRAFFCNPIYWVDPTGMFEDDHYINSDGSITTVETDDEFDRFYVQNDQGTGYNLMATLNKNAQGLVQFPATGNGFGRYGTVDAGGTSTNPAENVGQGDHWLRPEAAAALFGLSNELRKQGINISWGDMSSSNGSDPWQPGQRHHAGHGHNGRRSGMDADFRYINNQGQSFQSATATSDPQFNLDYNTSVYTTAQRFGFTSNYQGTNGTVPGVTQVAGHNDHGHLGLNTRSMNWQFAPVAPVLTPPALPSIVPSIPIIGQ